MAFTDAPLRLPSLVGTDVGELKKYVVIESRERVVRDIESFIEIAKKSSEPQVCLIVAEWGEGKTSIYEGFLKNLDKDCEILFLPGKTVVNYVKKLYRREILPEGELDGYRFTSALLLSLREEFESTRKGIGRDVAEIPRYQDFSNVGDYVNRSCESLFRFYSGKTIFLFVDEFEETVALSGDEIELVLSGLVELMNGYVKEVGPEGKFRGRFHLILSITPPAYQRLQSHGKFAQTINRLLQRNSIIKIPPVSREEGIRFIHGLLEYCYEGSIPKPHPIEPLEMYNTIFRISMGNLRAMSEIMRHLLSSAKVEAESKGYKEKISIITYDKFFEYLRDKKIFLYGGEIDIINNEIWITIENYLRDWAKYRAIDENITIEVFKYLCTILTPTDVTNISNSIDSSVSEVLRAIDLINSAIGSELKTRFGITSGCYKMRKLKGEYFKVRDQLELMIKRLLGFASTDIRIILDSLTWVTLEFDGNRIKVEKVIYLPDPSYESYYYLNEIGIKISESDAKYLCERLYEETRRKGLLDDGQYYLISPKLERLIYPAPEVMSLDFIKDRVLRIEIWRETLRNLSVMESEFVDSIPLLFVSTGISVGSDELYGYVLEKKVEEGKKYKISTIIKPVIGAVSENIISEIWRKVENSVKAHRTGKKERLPHLVIIFHTEQITPPAERKINEFQDKFRVRVLTFNLLPIQVQQLISVIKVTQFEDLGLTPADVYTIVQKCAAGEISQLEKINEKLGDVLDINTLIHRIRGIADDINLLNSLEVFLEGDCVVKPFSREIVANEKDLAEYYKYYLAYPSDKVFPDDVFKFAKDKILAFQYPGKTAGIISGKDIEDSEGLFIESARALEANNLLIRENRYYKFELTDIEKRILYLLENVYGGSALLETVEKSFVLHPSVPSWIFKDFYIPILVARGKISFEKDIITLLEFDEILSLIRINYERFSKAFEDFREYIKKYGCFCTSKKKGYRIIILDDFKKVVDEFYEKFNTQGRFDRELGLRLGWLILRMIKHFFGELSTKKEELGLLEMLKASIRKISTEISKLKSEREELTLKFNILKERLKEEFGIEISKVNEVEELDSLFDKTLEILKKEYTKEELEKIIDEDWKKFKEKDRFPFYFRSLRKPWMANIKLWLILKLWLKMPVERIRMDLYEDNVIEKAIEKLNYSINNILKKIDEIAKEKEKIAVRFQKLSAEGKNLTRLLASKVSVPAFFVEYTGELNSLQDLDSYLSSVLEHVRKIDESFSDIQLELERLNRIEKEFLHNLENLKIFEDFIINSMGKDTRNYVKLRGVYDGLQKLGQKPELTVEDISTLARSLQEKVQKLVKESKDIIEKYSSLLNRKKNELANISKRLKKFRDILDKLGMLEKIDPIDVINKVKRAQESINKVLRGLQTKPFNYNELIEETQKYEKNMRNAIKESGYISDNELKVYMAIEEVVEDEIEFREFIDIMASKTGLNKETVKLATLNLVSHGLLEVVVKRR